MYMDMDDDDDDRFGVILDKIGEFMYNDDDGGVQKTKSTAKSVEARQEGNELYKSKFLHGGSTHAAMLSLYTKSIALAEENSEEMALGYGNRSALLKHLRKYRECMNDIDKACEITKSEELKKKLTTRRRDCLFHVRKDKKDKPKTETFQFKPSKSIPCASELVTVKYNEKYGRHVVATQDIQPGTVIAVEKGYALFPQMDRTYINCSHCLAIAWNGIPCKSCNTTVYCSEKCKEEAWQEYHDLECPITPYLDSMEEDCGDMLCTATAIRVLFKAIKAEGLENILKDTHTVKKNKEKLDDFFDNNVFQCDKFKSVYNITTCQKRSEDDYESTGMIIMFLENKTTIFDKILKQCKSRIKNLDQIGDALLKLRYIAENSFLSTSHRTYQENTLAFQGTPFGLIVTPFCSLFNHSCFYNVERLFTPNREVLLFTTQFVPKGKQLFVNYGTTDLMSRDERRFYLNLRHDFICDCEGCKDNVSSRNPEYMLQTFDRGALLRVYAECAKARLSSTFSLLLNSPEHWTVSNSLLKDTLKVMNLIYKQTSGIQAYIFCSKCMQYLIYYYDNNYAIKNDVPSHCKA